MSGTEGTPVTRADRLLQLVENGSTGTAIRMMAAKQIASHIDALWSAADEEAGAQATRLFHRVIGEGEMPFVDGLWVSS